MAPPLTTTRSGHPHTLRHRHAHTHIVSSTRLESRAQTTRLGENVRGWRALGKETRFFGVSKEFLTQSHFS